MTLAKAGYIRLGYTKLELSSEH